MNRGWSSLVLFLVIAAGSYAQDCPATACPGTGLMYTCDGGFDWRIETETGNLVANITGESGNGTFGDDDEFRYAMIGGNRSRIWFDAEPEYRGYRVICLDDDEVMLLQCPVGVFSIYAPSILPVTFNDSMPQWITITWEDTRNTNCSVNYFVQANGNSYGPQAERSYQRMYNLSSMEQTVSVISTYNGYNATEVASTTFTVAVPSPIDYGNLTYPAPTGNGYDNVTIAWSSPMSSRPDVDYYLITHRRTATPPEGSGSGEGRDGDRCSGDDAMVTERVPGSQNTSILCGRFLFGETYYVSIIAQNIFGNSRAERMTFTPVAPPPTEEPTIPGLSTGAIVGIVIGAIALVVLVVVVIVVIVVVVVVVTKKRKSEKFELQPR